MAGIDTLIDSAIEGAATALEKAMSVQEKKMFKKVQELTRKLETKAGVILPNKANRAIIAKVEFEFRKLFNSKEFRDAIKAYTGVMGDIAESWDNYYTDMIGNAFNPDKKLFQIVYDEAVTVFRETMTGIGVRSIVTRPVQDLIRISITGRSSVAELETKLREMVQGLSGKEAGRLSRYTSQISRDSISQFTRNYAQAVAETFDLEWYFYTRGSVADTRDFCAVRHGKYFHKKEVEKWARMKWTGKIPATTSTTIFTYCGGYNCMHQLRAVLVDVVPNDDIARAESI